MFAVLMLKTFSYFVKITGLKAVVNETYLIYSFYYAGLKGHVFTHFF